MCRQVCISSRPRVHEELAKLLSAGDHQCRVVVHHRHHAALQRAVDALHEIALNRQCCSQWVSSSVFMLLRWEAMNMVQARMVVYLDLDVEISHAGRRCSPRRVRLKRHAVETMNPSMQ